MVPLSKIIKLDVCWIIRPNVDYNAMLGEHERYSSAYSTPLNITLQTHNDTPQYDPPETTLDTSKEG